MMLSIARFTLAVGISLGWVASAIGQIRDQILVYAQDANFNLFVHRYDRSFNLLGVTPMNGIASTWVVSLPALLTPNGNFVLALDPLNVKALVRLDSGGNIVSVKGLSHNPVGAILDRNGWVYVLTRIPLSTPGPMIAVDPSGTVQWSNWSATSTFNFYPDTAAITPAGDLYIAGGGPPCTPCLNTGKVIRIDRATGDPLGTLFTPQIPGSQSNTGLRYVFASPHGNVWAWGGGCPCFFAFQQETMLNSYWLAGGWSGGTYQSVIDAHGNLWTPGINNIPYNGRSVLKYDSSNGTLLEEIKVGGPILSMAMGPTGEELFLTTNNEIAFGQRSLRRINLVTLAQSSIPTYPELRNIYLPYGDPTGWNWAALIDREGDADGDGRSNGVETDAGSNPYDPLSRPNGPKVYVWFLPTTNAIAVRFIDPDGLLHPNGGLDLNTVTLIAEGYGDILPMLWPFASKKEISADGTDATIEFGLLPIPSDLQIRLDLRASDRKGFYGSDWQITPPSMAK